jgi:hypothetical protein
MNSGYFFEAAQVSGIAPSHTSSMSENYQRVLDKGMRDLLKACRALLSDTPCFSKSSNIGNEKGARHGDGFGLFLYPLGT